MTDAFMSGQRPRYIGPELRGPADADGFRVKVGRYGDRWYHDPLPGDHIAPAWDETVPSVSTVKKASGNDWSFVALERVAKALDTDKYRNLARWPYPDRYEALKAINKIGLNNAGNRGSNVHLGFDARLHGAPCPITDDMPGADYRNAIDQFFTHYNPTLVAAEFVCIHRTLNGVGYGGTADAIIEIDGLMSRRMRFLVDWKSRGADSDHGAYPEEAAQVSGYWGADYIIVEGRDGPERRLMPALDGGLIVSVKPDGCRIYPIDLDKGFAHWSALHAWWVARRDERESIGRQWPARKNVEGEVELGTTHPSASSLGPQPSPSTPDVEGEGGACSLSNRQTSPSTLSPPSPAAATPGEAGPVADRPPCPPGGVRIVVIGGPWPERIGCTGVIVEGDPKVYPMAGKGDSEVIVKLDHDPLLKPDPGMFDATDTWYSCVIDRGDVKVATEALAWASQPAPAPLPALPADPDEGGNLVDKYFKSLEAKYKKLDAVDRAWISRLVSEATRANVGFHTQGHPSDRRFFIIRGLVDLAKAGSPDDDVLRALCVAALHNDAPLDERHTPGACVGSLDDAAAQRFATLVDQYVGTSV